MAPRRADFQPLARPDLLSWVHFGDLHLTTADAQNYRDLLALIAEANAHLTGPTGVNFALLPGDNADHGAEDEYRLLAQALGGLRLPLHALPGDHDIQGGDLRLFRRWLEPVCPRSFVAGSYRVILLNAVDIEGVEGFGMRAAQLTYFKDEVALSRDAGQTIVLFVHLYPSQLGDAAAEFTETLRRCAGVRLVEMGHTHYNELANDGHIIYAATRSTGQIEEGPVGFSITCLDGDVVSWRFKALASPWPFVMITSPADQVLRTAASEAAGGPRQIKARAWDKTGVTRMSCQVDGGAFEPMQLGPDGVTWISSWQEATTAGIQRITVRAENAAGDCGEDRLERKPYAVGDARPAPRASGDRENRIGVHLHKGILGTLLGPNENGHPW